MEREAIIAGNWKMHKTEQETIEFIETITPLVATPKAHIYLAVPFTAISSGVGSLPIS